MKAKSLINQSFVDLAEACKVSDFETKLELVYNQAPQIIDYLINFNLKNGDNKYIKNYVQDAIARFFYTLSLFPHIKNSNILEIGSNPYLLTILLNRTYKPQITYTNFFDTNIYSKKVSTKKQTILNKKYEESYTFKSTLFNVENTPYPFKKNSFDMVLFCEVMEHLVINPLVVFKEFWRILKRGGYLLLTTPNAARLTNIATLLQGENIFDLYHPQNGVFGRHNREFTIQELTTIVKENNFTIKYAQTHDRFDYNLVDIHSVGYNGINKINYKKDDLIKKLKKLKANTSNLGDNIYILCQKN